MERGRVVWGGMRGLLGGLCFLGNLRSAGVVDLGVYAIVDEEAVECDVFCLAVTADTADGLRFKRDVVVELFDMERVHEDAVVRGREVRACRALGVKCEEENTLVASVARLSLKLGKCRRRLVCRTSEDERGYITRREDVADACQEAIELREDEDTVVHRE